MPAAFPVLVVGAEADLPPPGAGGEAVVGRLDDGGCVLPPCGEDGRGRDGWCP